MSVRLVIGCYEDSPVAMYDSVTGFAFGPTLADEDEAETFLEFVAEKDGRDPREIPDSELGDLLKKFQGGEKR